MSDLIDRQAAIDVVSKYNFDFPQYMERFVTELRDAMKADLKHDIEALPSAEPDVPDTNVGGMICRQAAIDALCNDYCGGHQDCKYYPNCENLKSIEQLPYAQPERKKDGKCSNELPCGWCSLFDTPCFGRGGEQDARFNQQTGGD